MTCDGNSQLLKEKWVSILYHTANNTIGIRLCCTIVVHTSLFPQGHIVKPNGSS